MKPKSLRACVQRMLPEIETMLVMGTTREDVYTEVCQRYGLEKTTIRNFDTALYRARQTAKKIDSVLHNTGSTEPKKTVLHKTESSSPCKDVLHDTEESNPSGNVLHNTQSNPGITTQEGIDKIHSKIDYSEFKTKKY